MKQSIYYFIDKFKKNEIEKLNRKISIVYRNYKKKLDIDEIKSLVRFLLQVVNAQLQALSL